VNPKALTTIGVDGFKPPDPGASWEIDYSELVFGPELGSGDFGVVYKGEWRQTPVAIKKLLNADLLSPQELDDFRSEAALMVALRPHVNVVLCVGICTKALPFCIVTEFVEGGSLQRLLQSNARLPPPPQMRKLIKGICLGLNHLHCENLVHRDLAARNILLKPTNYGYEAKISDFGLSRKIEAKESTSQTKSDTGPLKYMAPECLIQRAYSNKSDVWSLAVLLVEIYSRNEPYPNLDSVQVASLVARGELVPQIPSNAPAEIGAVIRDCSKWDPAQRPSMNDICQRI